MKVQEVFGTNKQTVTVPLRDITKDETLQVRAKLSEKTIKKYTEAMKAGSVFPPVRLARVDGSLLLVDGWHRVEAAIDAEQDKIEAVIQVMTRNEAEWEAAQANLTHGLPLQSKQEYREVFKAFIRAKKYRQGNRWLSYREMAAVIGKAHTTIRNWMEEDFPKLFKVYKMRDEQRPDTEPPDQRVRLMRLALRQAKDSVDNARNLGRYLDEQKLGELVKRLEDALVELKEHPYEPVQEHDDF